jgi:hypothetical protein
MTNKKNVVRPKRAPAGGEPTPPQLSEKLIAQLQGAVVSAQRRRMVQPPDPGTRNSPEKDL